MAVRIAVIVCANSDSGPEGESMISLEQLFDFTSEALIAPGCQASQVEPAWPVLVILQSDP